jgi:hypothetical protein
MAPRAHTVHLHPGTFDQLELEASKRHVEADELADELVRAGLAETTARAGTGLREALLALDVLSTRLPEVDAVRIVQEGREELGARTA